jgi:putative transcriptional regulator
MNRIKEVLKEKGISQTWLADKMGKSYNTINEYARNKIQPSIEVLFTISEILNMEAKELIEKRDLKDNK